MYWVRLFLQLLRLKVASMLYLFALLGILSTLQKPILTALDIIVLVVSLSAWYVNATSINDIADKDIDEINLKKARGRPLISKTASLRQMYCINAVAGCIALAGAMVFGAIAAGVMFVCIVLNYAYSLPPIRISYRAYIAPLLLPLGYVALPFLLGVYATNARVSHTSLALLISVYTAFIGRIILKDIRDIKGDSKYGKRTFTVRHGKKATCYVSIGFWTLGLVTLLIGQSFTIIQAIAILFLFALIVYCVYLVTTTNKHDTEQLYIGLAARCANGLIVLLCTYLLLHIYNYPPSQLSLTMAVLSILYGYATLLGVQNLHTLTNDYRG